MLSLKFRLAVMNVHYYSIIVLVIAHFIGVVEVFSKETIVLNRIPRPVVLVTHENGVKVFSRIDYETGQIRDGIMFDDVDGDITRARIELYRGVSNGGKI